MCSVDERILGSALVRNAYRKSALQPKVVIACWPPLMKNCRPSAKNLAPLTEIVGMAVIIGNAKLAMKASWGRGMSMLAAVSRN